MIKFIWPLFLFSFTLLLSKDISELQLKRVEKQWMESISSREVTIYLDDEEGILNYSQGGGKAGSLPEGIKTLKKITNLNIKVIECSPDDLKDAINSGIPDLVFGREELKEANPEYSYSEKSINLRGAMLTRLDEPAIDYTTDISDKTVVYVEGDRILDKFRKGYGDKIKTLPKPSIESAVSSLLSGEGDIYMDDLRDSLEYLANNPMLNINLNYLSKDLGTSYYFGGKKEYLPLINIIERLLKENDANREFTYNQLMNYTKGKLRKHTEIEKYLDGIDTLSIYAPANINLYPIYYRNKRGQVDGLLERYFLELEDILHITLDLQSKLEVENLDINPFIIDVNGREINNGDYLTTSPYYTYKIFIFANMKDNYFSNLYDLKNHRIGVAKGSIEESYFIHKNLRENLVVFSNYDSALTALSRREIDVFMGDIKHANEVIYKRRIKDIEVSGSIDDRIDIKFGVPKEKETLFFILNSFDRTLNYALDIKRKELLRHNKNIVTDYRVLLLVILILLLFLLRRRRHIRDLNEGKSRLEDLVIRLVDTLEAANTYNDKDTGDHVKRLNQYSHLLAREMKLSKEFLKDIGLYASLHDIGKIGIPDTVLKKPGKLTKEEFDEMKLHTEIGYKLMDGLNISRVASNIVRYHHEKWDGSGYPKGLSGEEIPIEARIVALADVYDALRQKRVYKEAFTHEKALEIISCQSEKHFDPQVVNVFLIHHNEFKKIFGS